MKNALSVARIRALQPQARLYKVTDGRGLVLEVRPSGTLTWRLRYTLHRRRSEINLGRFPAVSLADARARREVLLNGIAEGKSPTEQRRVQKLAEERGETVEMFGNKYLQGHVSRRRRDIAPIRRYLERDVYPLIGNKAIAAIHADDVRELIFRRVEGGKPQSALALRNLLKRLWDYALVRGVVDKNPLAAIPAKFVAEVSSRNRALQPPEIAAFLKALETAKVRLDLKIALRLILLTLTRKGEMRQARWEEFHLERGEWEIPEAHSKTVAQIVYLSRQAVELLRELKAGQSKHTHCLFPALWGTDTPMSASTLNRALARVPVKISHFTVHDLRRTAATNLSEHGYAPDVIEKALNHKIKGVRGIYNRAAYAEPRREMLQAWADWLDGLRSQSGSG
jgi:integrase